MARKPIPRKPRKPRDPSWRLRRALRAKRHGSPKTYRRQGRRATEQAAERDDEDES